MLDMQKGPDLGQMLTQIPFLVPFLCKKGGFWEFWGLFWAYMNKFVTYTSDSELESYGFEDLFGNERFCLMPIA